MRLALYTFLIAGIFLCGAWWKAARAEDGPSETVFYTTGYSYDYANHPGAPEVAQTLCKDRCNSLSESRSKFMPTGWRLIRLPGERTRRIDIGNPFIGGECICTGYEYIAEKVVYEKP
jgi:hypothetical protein